MTAGMLLLLCVSECKRKFACMKYEPAVLNQYAVLQVTYVKKYIPLSSMVIIIIFDKVDTKACSDHIGIVIDRPMSLHPTGLSDSLSVCSAWVHRARRPRQFCFLSAIFSPVLNICSSFRVVILLILSRKVWPATFLKNFISSVLY
jgi:hypothetical protein